MTWTWHRLGDVLVSQPNRKVVQQGWSPRCHPQPAPDGEWGVLKTTAIQDGRFEPEHNKLLPDQMAPREQIEVHPGDLLLTCAGPRARCGVPALVRHTRARLMMSGKMYRFRPDERVLPTFLELWLRSPEAQRRIDAMKTGISDSGLNLTHDRFVELPVPVPPLEDQRRIVDLLEDHLSRLNAADTYVATARQRLGALAIASLWNATHDLSDARLVALEQIAEVRLGRQRSPKNHTGERMRPYLRAANVGWDELRLNDVYTMQFTEAEEKIYRLEPGDILLAEASGSPSEVGKSALYEGLPAGVCFQNTLLRVRCHSANPAFIQKYLLAEAYAGRFMPEARGVGINHLGRAKLAALPVALPPARAQEHAVARCRDLIGGVVRLRAELDSAAQRSAALRRSVLAAAFSGRFTCDRKAARV